MKKTRIAAIAVVVAILVGGAFVFAGRAGNGQPEPQRLVEETAPEALGISYLQVTPGVSHCYQVAVDSGALVTEVAAGSPADRAGLRAGDIIVGFDGTRLDEENPLLAVMIRKPLASRVALEVHRGDGTMMMDLQCGPR